MFKKKYENKRIKSIKNKWGRINKNIMLKKDWIYKNVCMCEVDTKNKISRVVRIKRGENGPVCRGMGVEYNCQLLLLALTRQRR